MTQILTLITAAASKLTPCYNFMIRFPFHMHTANAASETASILKSLKGLLDVNESS